MHGIGIAMGVVGAPATPGWRKKLGIQGKCVSARPAYQVHPQAEQQSIFMTFVCWEREIWRSECFILEF